MERETPITTDLTGGKKADMKRPTKPVMWTDLDSVYRLESWLIQMGYVKTKSDIGGGGRFDFIKGEVSLVLIYRNTSWWRYDSVLWESINKITNIEKISLVSLLHDLNIIKPIGRLEYTSEWIDKILSGQKTMDILSVQHVCGYYELWDTERQKVRGIVEVVMVSKQIFSYECERIDISGRVVPDDINPVQFSIKNGFDSFAELLDYHRNNFQSVKYAITYRVIDMKGDNNV